MNLVSDYIIGQFDALTVSLIMLCFVELLSRIIATFNKRKLTKKFLIIEISKKLLILTIVFIGYIIDTFILSSKSNLRILLILFYISDEGLRVIENSQSLGIPMPKNIQTLLTKIKKNSNIT